LLSISFGIEKFVLYLQPVFGEKEDYNGTAQISSEMLPKVCSMLDKLAKRNIIHKNKAANLKSSLTVHVNKL
jgi:ribosomal protein S20